MISVNKIFFVLLALFVNVPVIFGQNSFESQFELAEKLYSEEKYFDAVTEFKRLLYFDESGYYDFNANLLIGLCYKKGGKLSEAIEYFSLAKLNSNSNQDYFESSIEIIKINILRRTTGRAFALLDTLANDTRFVNKIEEINYWRGWAYIFSDDWETATSTFSKYQDGQRLASLCDSVNSELYNPQLAKYLSIIPGAGQFYTGEYVSGLISIGWNVLWGYLTIEAFIEERVFDGVLIGSLLWWRFYSGNIQNAEKFALEKNLEITNTALYFLQQKYGGEKP